MSAGLHAVLRVAQVFLLQEGVHHAARIRIHPSGRRFRCDGGAGGKVMDDKQVNVADACVVEIGVNEHGPAERN